jgi:hypothetical protein
LTRYRKSGYSSVEYLGAKVAFLYSDSAFISRVAIIASVLCFSYVSQTYGSGSPVFTTQEISDDPHDFVGVKNSDFTGNASKCVMVGNNLHIPNIDSVKYVSDGRVLNATVYLTQPFAYLLDSSIYRNITTSLNVGYV